MYLLERNKNDAIGSAIMSDVFVIGAGSSVPYGFPTGVQLMQELKDFEYKYDKSHYNEPNDYLFRRYPEKISPKELARNIGFPFQYTGVVLLIHNIIKEFSTTIKKSVMVSIDEFLKNRLEHSGLDLADFGKRLIASRILYYENQSEISRKIKIFNKYSTIAPIDYSKYEAVTEFNGISDIDWIQHLLSRVDQTDDWQGTLLNTIFLTFNYDRLLEQMLFNYITCDKQESQKTALAFIDSLNIFHVNGCIGNLNDISFGKIADVDYEKASQRMETVWEKMKNKNRSDDIKKYKKYVQSADRIYFLGFSYIYENLKSIGIERKGEILKNKEIYGSAFGLSFQTLKRINSYLGIDIDSYKVPNRILKDAKAIDVILDHYTINEAT